MGHGCRIGCDNEKSRSDRGDSETYDWQTDRWIPLRCSEIKKKFVVYDVVPKEERNLHVQEVTSRVVEVDLSRKWDVVRT